MKKANTTNRLLAKPLLLIMRVIHRARVLVRKILGMQNWHRPGKHYLSARRAVKYAYYKFKRTLRVDRAFYPVGSSDISLSVFMPTVEKDAETLPLALQNLRKYVRHPISDIYIVAPSSAVTVKKIAKEYDCIFVPEDGLLPLKKSDIKYVHNGENRGGWVYKMLLNLYADSVCSERYILILDSDTVFIRPQRFIYKNRVIVNESPLYHKPYYEANKRLLGLKHSSCMSYITHYMLFDATILKELRANIEEKNNKPWCEAIISNIDTNESSGFADYEIYGDYAAQRKVPMVKNFWLVCDQRISKRMSITEMERNYSRKFGAIALHNYARD